MQLGSPTGAVDSADAVEGSHSYRIDNGFAGQASLTSDAGVGSAIADGVYGVYKRIEEN